MSKYFALITLSILLLVLLFGLNLTMNINKNGKMANCPLMNEYSSLCKMPITDHLSKWLQMFTAAPTIFNLLILLATLFISFKFFILQFTLAPPTLLAFRRYKFNYPENKLFNWLIWAFSDGILHPKIP